MILIALATFDSHDIKNKAAGINVDLWTVLGMLMRALTRPVMSEPPKTRGRAPGRLRRAPA